MPHDQRATVLITGSSGFLGQTIARAILGRYRVIGLDQVLPDDPPEGMESLEFDLTSDESVASALRKVRQMAGERIASVIHLAAYYDTSGEDSPLYEAVTVEGTRRLLRHLEGLKTEQFQFSSTMLVHAPSPAKGVAIDESAPIDPAWAYPQSKADTESVIRQERGDIDAVIFRFAGVYDENCGAAFIAQQIARIYERLPTAYLFTGDLSHGQSYVHVDDLVDAVVRAVDRRDSLPDETAILIGEPETASYAQMQREIGKLVHGEDWRTLSLPKALTEAGAWTQEEVLGEDTYIRAWMVENADDHYELDISRARTLLDWSPRHRLLDTLPEMIRRLKADPAAWYAANGLDPSVVAGADGELAAAEARLGEPLERSEDEVEAAIRDHRRFTLWAPLVNAALGLWLIASPFAYGLFDPVEAPVPPALGHAIAEASVRNAWLGISQMVSGLLVVVLSLWGMQRWRMWAHWGVAGVGTWLALAPLVFWNSSAAAYNIDTLIGMLVVAFAVIIPPTPGIANRALAADDDRPLGWSYSPSAFTQRLPIIAMAFVGFFISRYLAAYQLGHIDGLWDPFFGPGSGGAITPEGVGEGGPAGARNGTEAVVTSWVSKGFPIVDAGLGAFAYLLDVLAGSVGDRRRWRTMPWMVILFGLLIVPLGAVSVSFIMIQPPLIGALCTLCIVQAAVTVVLIPYSIDEVLASCQYLYRAKKAGEPFWRTFWRGGPALGEDQTPERDLARPARTVLAEFVTGGVNFPRTLVASVGVGILLMASPVLSGTEAPLYFSDHVTGCLVILVAVTAMAEIARALRFANVALGMWIVVSPFVLEGAGTAGTIGDVVLGLALIGLSLPRGTRSEEHYGGWDRLIV